MKNLLLILLLVPVLAGAEIVDITFEPPTTREDGTALPANEIAGYDIYNNGIEIPADSVTYTDNSIAIELPYGRHAIKMRTTDTNGRFSLYSNVLVFILNANPKPPRRS